MSSFNRVIIAGNLTRDPELKQFNNNAVCKLGLASNRQYKNRNTGDMVQEVCYVDIDVWGPQAESCSKYLEKGRAVLVEGRLKFDSWKDNEGQTRSKHIVVADRVVFLYNQADSQNENRSDSDEGVKLDKDLEDQINSIKKSKSNEEFKASKAAESKKKSKSESDNSASNDNSDMDFQDEPPFQDDLPF